MTHELSDTLSPIHVATTASLDTAPAPAKPTGVTHATTETVFRRGDLVDRYVIVSVLGEGGMGIVYVAYDPELNRRVAIKLLRYELAASAALQEPHARLLREAQALARLSHPNVVSVHDVGTIGEQVWLAMELIEGQTLSGWLKQAAHGWREIVDVFCRAGRGLQAAHEVGLVHRDFKPDNVMVGVDGRICVMDFGLARQESQVASEQLTESLAKANVLVTERMTRTGVLQGTPAYMAPEQWAGITSGAHADQFSFCVALYEALYKVHPFGRASLHDLRNAVLNGAFSVAPSRTRIPGRIFRILRRGFAVEPEQRWPSMAALLARISHHG